MRHLINPIRTALAMLLGMVCVAASAMEHNRGDCPAVLPAEAMAISEPRLCRTADIEESDIAVCREYSDDRQIYQLVFRGGTSPHAVYELITNSTILDAIVLKDAPRRAVNRRCDLERPAGVPAKAIYRGTGVCEDERGRSLPCSLFEHAGARESEAKRYFVYYDPNGRGVLQIEIVPAGRNRHAFEAELAHQLAQAMYTTGCCRERAREYAAYAAALFPDDIAYRTALQRPEAPAARQTTATPDCTPGSTTSMNPPH